MGGLRLPEATKSPSANPGAASLTREALRDPRAFEHEGGLFMYVITGATGNTGSIVANRLLDSGQKVRVVGRNLDRLRPFKDRGAEAFMCDLTDPAALSRAFSGADAVYAMTPPDSNAPDFRDFQEQVSDALAAALEASKVHYAVTLSSVGADKPSGTGPVVGLHNLEEKLNRIAGLNIMHLRAAYFMENTLAQASIVPLTGMTAGPLRPDLRLPMIAARDIGEAAYQELAALKFQGRQTRELLGPRDYTMTEVAAIIGKAIGRPGLAYMQLPEVQVRSAMIQMGMSGSLVDLILEMSGAMNSSHMVALEPRTAHNSTPTTYETFVAESFVPQYWEHSSAA
jgi:uncharacterized protein YbjT (DUF2867 family)